MKPTHPILGRAMRAALVWACLAGTGCTTSFHDTLRMSWVPEQQAIGVRSPTELAPAPIPEVAPPPTVTNPPTTKQEWRLSLDDVLKMAVENAKIVRVLGGNGASSTGRTIYDPAITLTSIDQQQARFDPTLNQRNTFNRTDSPLAVIGPLGPTLTGSAVDQFRSEFGVSKTNTTGGTGALNWVESHTRSGAALLNPQFGSALELSYTQPLLQGAGYLVNTAPIVLARVDTERSYFQFKDALQELVRSTISGYWNLVQARLDVWAREIQIEQAEEALRREEARKEAGLANLRDVSQARVTLNQFRASLIAAKANVLDAEGALRNVLGLPPSDDRFIVPMSAPTDQRLKPAWKELLQLAEQRRPDIIELKLILEADQVRRTQAQNLALPRLDANALYRWNGVSGEIPNGTKIATDHGQFADWSVGVNFAVPLWLREGRAQVRQQELLIVRDQANLQQGLHAATHELAVTLRDVENAYEQYVAFKATRAAALDNLKIQIAETQAGRGIYLNILQALNDWGSAVTSEARSLTNYNIALATLERQTGTILETHGLVLAEERFRSAGPLGLFGHERDYPQGLKPSADPHRYPGKETPGENAFDLQKPNVKRDPDPVPKKEPKKEEPKANLVAPAVLKVIEQVPLGK